MDYRSLGRTGVMVSPLCLGAMNLGGPTGEEESLAILNRALSCNVGRGEVAESNEFRVFCLGFLQAGNMFLGNDQHVGWTLRVDIFKGEGVHVFINFLGGDFAAKNAAE